MESENPDTSTTAESLLSEIPTLKSEVENLKDALQFLDINIGKRCRNITNLLVSQELSRLGEKSREISEEYNALLQDLNKSVGKMGGLTDGKGSIYKQIDLQPDDDYTKRKSFKFLDQRRVSHNLLVLISMVEDYKNDNKKLKIRSRLLTKQILTIVHTLLAQMREGAGIVFDEDDSTMADETDFVVMDEILEQFTALKMNIHQQANYMFEETRSLSNEVLRPSDASFDLCNSETKLMTAHDWKNSIARLKTDQEEMNSADKRLKAIKLARSKKP